MSHWTDPRPNDGAPTVLVDLGAPLGVREASTWEDSREIVGSLLPGNIRGQGLSIGGADLTVGHTDLAVTPWARGTNRIRAGGDARLWAENDGDDPMPMGDWIIGAQTGSITKAGMKVELLEAQYDGRRQDNLLPMLPRWSLTEPSWVIDVLGRQLGYYSTPAPVASCVGSLPMNGGLWEEVSSQYADMYEPVPGWGGVRAALGIDGAHSVIGSLGVQGYSFVQGLYIPRSVERLMDDVPLFLTLDTVGPDEQAWFGYGDFGQVHVKVDAVAHTLSVRAGAARPWVAVSYVPGLNADWPDRVQIQLERTGTPDNPSDKYDTRGTYGPCRARIRSTHDAAAWSAWAVDSWVGLSNGIYDLDVRGPAGSSFCGLQVTTEADPLLWAPATASIDPLGGIITAPYLPADVDAWTGMQQYAAAWLGAVWRDRGGVLQLRERGYLAGNGEVRERIDVDERVEDLPWVLDPDDTADRVVVTYSPVDQVDGVPGDVPVLWESPEAIRLGPRESRTLTADLDRLGYELGAIYSPDYAAGWVPAWQFGSGNSSSWAANPSRDGSGPQPGDNAIEVVTRRISTGRVEVTVRNVTSQVLWTVDGEGRPHLIMRGGTRMDQEQQAVIERGLPEREARNPLTVDLGKAVQRPEDAEQIADLIYSRLSSDRLLRINTLRVVPDWTRDIGQIAALVHPRSGLEVKVLVVRVVRSGSAAGARQYLDVVWLPPTVGDVDRAWAGRTVGDFDDLWSGRTVADFTDNPLWIGDS